MKRQVGVVRTCVRCLKKTRARLRIFRLPQKTKTWQAPQVMCFENYTQRPSSKHSQTLQRCAIFVVGSCISNQLGTVNVAIHTKSRPRDIPNNTTSKLLQPQKSASSLVRLHVSHDKREKNIKLSYVALVQANLPWICRQTSGQPCLMAHKSN